MQRTIVRFVEDDAGDRVAELECYHRLHVRHDALPETALDCRSCDVAELPDGLEVVRTTATWDGATMPAGLRRAHRVAAGTWARLRVEQGALRFRAQTEPVIDVIIAAGASQAIPPDVDHEVEPRDSAQFSVEFLRPKD